MEELAAYYHWDDPQSLEQAVWVAQQNDFDFESIALWSEKENAVDKFNIFKEKIGRK